MASVFHRSGRALLETLRNVTTGTTTTSSTATPVAIVPKTSSNNNDNDNDSLRDLSPYQHFLHSLTKPDMTSSNHHDKNGTHLDWMLAHGSNLTRHLNETAASLDDENETDFSTWLSIRLVLIVSVLACIGLLAFGSYKLHLKSADRKKRRRYKSTLLVYGEEVTFVR